MIGLLKKDLYVLFHAYHKNFLFVTVLYCALALFSPKISFVLYFLCWIAGFYIVSSITIDNSCKWDLYAAGLPLKKSHVVGAKFLLVVITLAAFSLFCCLLFGILSLFQPISFPESLMTMAIILPLILIYFGITLALSYKVGPEKARTFMLILLVIVAVLIFFSAQSGFFDNLVQNPAVQSFFATDTPPALFYGVEWGAGLVIYLICWLAGTHAYSHKEF